ncbi:MAG: solute carrier family 26 protein [Congregibacter sp.]
MPITLPPLAWLKGYTRGDLLSDTSAALVVTVMLIPQSLAYALLAGLPPEMGLYSSILPLLAYACFGSSRTLSVGPVAVVSLMTATAIGKVAESGSLGYASAAIAMSLLSGFMLLGMGLMRLGFLANLLSHPVTSGFISASAIIIALSQLGKLLGVSLEGDNLIALVRSLGQHVTSADLRTAAIGMAVLLFLISVRRYLAKSLQRCGVPTGGAVAIARTAPVLAVIGTTLLSAQLEWDTLGVAIVGEVPIGLPAFSVPGMDLRLWSELAVSALLISIIGFVESVSVGTTLGAKRRERIDADQELLGLGVANVASGLSGGFPVSGGFSRSVVNFDAGARTQLAGVFTALCIALVSLTLTPALYHLPKATLAATIIVAVLGLIDVKLLKSAWRYSTSDFTAISTTLLGTLCLGVEIGVMLGIGVSILLHLHKTSRPHIAVVGELPGTEHFRNVRRHDVITYPNIVSLRVDESLYFVNARYMEDAIYAVVAEHAKGPEQALEHVILQCTAVNEIDLSALESLESVMQRLDEQSIKLHLSEVKGPVMDALQRTSFIERLTGEVFLSQHQACEALKPQGSPC